MIVRVVKISATFDLYHGVSNKKFSPMQLSMGSGLSLFYLYVWEK